VDPGSQLLMETEICFTYLHRLLFFSQVFWGWAVLSFSKSYFLLMGCCNVILAVDARAWCVVGCVTGS
jgi:hypothetical protein